MCVCGATRMSPQMNGWRQHVWFPRLWGSKARIDPGMKDDDGLGGSFRVLHEGGTSGIIE